MDRPRNRERIDDPLLFEDQRGANGVEALDVLLITECVSPFTNLLSLGDCLFGDGRQTPFVYGGLNLFLRG